MVVSELRGEKIDIIPWNTEPARFVAKALSPARVREVYIDDDTREATVIVPNDQLALAIGKEGLNARLATRLCGWKIDIQSETEFSQAEAEAAFAGDSSNEEYSGRCAAILSNGKRCPNAALPGSPYCGVPAHQELANAEANGDGAVAAPVAAEVETTADEDTADEAVAVEEQRVEAVSASTVADADAETEAVEESEAAVAVAEGEPEQDGEAEAAPDED
jgi:N utilization substance protein A